MFVALAESPSFEATGGRGHLARASLQRVAHIDADFMTPEAATNRMTRRQSIFTRHYARLNVGASIAFFSIAFVAYAVITWSPVFLTTSGFTLAESLRATMAFNVAAVSAALINAFLIDRFGSRTALLICGGGILLGLAALLYALTGELTASRKLLATLAIGASGAFTGAGLAAVYALLTCSYPSQCRGAGIGFGMMMGRLGAITTIVLSGFLLGLGDDDIVPFVVASSIAAVLALGGTCLIDRHIPARR